MRLRVISVALVVGWAVHALGCSSEDSEYDGGGSAGIGGSGGSQSAGSAGEESGGSGGGSNIGGSGGSGESGGSGGSGGTGGTGGTGGIWQPPRAGRGHPDAAACAGDNNHFEHDRSPARMGCITASRHRAGVLSWVAVVSLHHRFSSQGAIAWASLSI